MCMAYRGFFICDTGRRGNFIGRKAGLDRSVLPLVYFYSVVDGDMESLFGIPRVPPAPVTAEKVSYMAPNGGIQSPWVQTVALLVCEVWLILHGASADPLFPSNRNQGGSDIIDAPFSDQEVELGCGVVCVQHVDPHAQGADGLAQLGADGADLGADAEDQQVGPGPDDAEKAEGGGGDVPLALAVNEAQLARRGGQPWPPLEGLTADEDNARAVDDARAAVELEARRHAHVNARRRYRRAAQHVERVELRAPPAAARPSDVVPACRGSVEARRRVTCWAVRRRAGVVYWCRRRRREDSRRRPAGVMVVSGGAGRGLPQQGLQRARGPTRSQKGGHRVGRVVALPSRAMHHGFRGLGELVLVRDVLCVAGGLKKKRHGVDRVG